MMRKTLPIILIFVFFGLAFGQETETKATTNCRGGGLMIGNALSLPKPVFPQGGNYKPLVNTIIVSVTIDENGNVIEANAIAGHPLFRQSSVQAARFSKFTPSFVDCEKVRAFTEISYTFDGLKGTVKVKNPILRQMKVPEKSNPPKILGIINGLANRLPKPIYPQEAKDFCVSGKVEVEVLVDEKGNVIDAKAISGDELLLQSSVDAAKNAKFEKSPHFGNSKFYGLVIYNFRSENKCLIVDQIVNKKTIYRPALTLNQEEQNFVSKTKNQIVYVQIIVNMEGEVTHARAVSGRPVLHKICIGSALLTKFAPSLINGPKIIVRTKLRFKFNKDGTVEF